MFSIIAVASGGDDICGQVPVILLINISKLITKIE
jgi:hypothetical protein